jgi:hypothetical protein
MPDINNAIALGVQTPKPQTTTDIIAPISSLAQLSYLGANTDRVKAETAGLEQTAAFTRGKNQSLQSFNDMHSKGMPVAEALDRSGLAGWDPPGANAILGNETTGRTLAANAAYAKANPKEPLAIGGPELVGKDVTNKSVAATTAETNVKVTQAHLDLYGRAANVMTSPGGATPQGRQIAADMSREAGIPEEKIQAILKLPDDQYVLVGHQLRAASMNPEPFMRASGQEQFNQGLAKAATSQEKVGAGETVARGPANYAVTHGLPVPGMPGGAPSSGVVGSPSLGNFAAAGNAPAANVPSLGNAPPPAGSFTPAAPAVPGSGPAATPAGAGPAAPAVPVRNVNAVSVPSVGVNIPPEITEVGKKYEAQRPGLAAYLGRTSQMESGGNPNAYNSGSKAAGPFQFVPATGAAYLNGKSPFDLAGSADAAARLAIDNDRSLTKSLGQSPTDAQLYLAHQQGAGGAAKLLLNPNARAGDLVGNSAIASNGGNPNAPASAFTNLWATKFNGGVGRSIPGAALSPNVTPLSPAAAPGIAPGAIAPLAAALTPQPAPGLPAPAAPPPPLQAAPAQNVAPAAPAVPVAQPGAGGAPPPTGLAADNTRPLLPQGYQPVDAGPSKAVLAEQEAQGAAYGKLPEELDKAATTAKTTNATLDEMSAAAENFRMGKWSDHEQSLREMMQAAATTLGVKNPALEQATASYQDLGKLGGQVVRQAAHDLGSRTGVQELQMITKTNPNAQMTEGGFKTVVAQMKGLNDFQIAKQQAAAAWKASNGNSLGPSKSGQDFQAAWNANASPAAFVLHRMEQENPQGVNNLISTMQKTPEGRAALKNIAAQSHWAESNGLLGKQ